MKINPLTLLLSPTVAVHDHVWLMCEDHIMLDKKGQNHSPSTTALSHYTQRCLSNTVHTALKHQPNHHISLWHYMLFD